MMSMKRISTPMTITEVMLGSTTSKNRLMGGAPSHFAASSWSSGTFFRPARKMSAMNGVHSQTSAMMMAAMAQAGSPRMLPPLSSPTDFRNQWYQPNEELKR